MTAVTESEKREVITKLMADFPYDEQRIRQGVEQVAQVWSPDDDLSDFAEFCYRNFQPASHLGNLFFRLSDNFEQIRGHFAELSRFLSRPFDVEIESPVLGVDRMFSAWDPGAHVQEDLFRTGIAYVVLLNFPNRTPEEILQKGSSWTRPQWAQARLCNMRRVPARAFEAVNNALTDANYYISQYRVPLHRLLWHGQPLYHEEERLISHWGLRDRIKALYAEGETERQQALACCMEGIVRQTIPDQLVPGDPLDEKGEWDTAEYKQRRGDSEPDTRYKHLMDVFLGTKELDKYYPDAPTHIDRKFNLKREIPEADVEKMLIQVLEAPVAKDIADMIQTQLGRKLEPFDIWYDGFKPRSSINEAELDRKVQERWATIEDFKSDLANVLMQLGFEQTDAVAFKQNITMERARGAGHASGPARREDRAYLRTHMSTEDDQGQGVMNYQCFNTIMHELGHCVEMTISSLQMEYPDLAGVPNIAFSEAFAFAFQDRDLEILGVQTDDNARHWQALDTFWTAREIAGVSLVDMAIWRWMTSKSSLTPTGIRQRVIDFAQKIWNRYFVDLFGDPDCTLLGVYSHMIDCALYLPDYPLGHIIASQIRRHLASRSFATEMKRICQIGNVTPSVWMHQAVGQDVSPDAMIEGATEAVKMLR